MKALVLLTVLAALSCMTDLTQGADRPNEIVINLTKQSREQNHVVVFFGRPLSLKELSPGHAFVVTGKRKGEVKGFVADPKDKAFGFYPEKGKESGKGWTLDRVPGKILRDYVRTADVDLLVVVVSAEQMSKIQALQKKWSTPQSPHGTYKVMTKDCVSFVAECVKALGLRLPKRKAFDHFPRRFVKELIMMNR